MQAIEMSEFGSPDVLKIAQLELPVAISGEVLIKVFAAGVNRPDVFQRKGHYAPPVGASTLLGLEVSGVIVSGDVQGSGFAIGDSVCALVQGGGYAQYCVAPIKQCLPIPKGMNFLEAASLPETYFTVWSNLFDRGGLKKGESILIHGGTSGIGVAAIQLAKAFGAKVFITAGTNEKCQFALSIGADFAINYKLENFEEKIKLHTQGQGVDVILDMVAGKYLNQNINSLKDDGRLIVIALLGGAKGDLDLSQILRRRLTITGSTLRPRSVEFKYGIAQELKEKVWPLIEEGKFKVVIEKTFPLDKAKNAHELMESGQHIGKIMLMVDH